MWPFKCKHPKATLMVEKEQTVERMDNSEFELVTYHLFCTKCNENVRVMHHRIIGNVKDFLNRKE